MAAEGNDRYFPDAEHSSSSSSFHPRIPPGQLPPPPPLDLFPPPPLIPHKPTSSVHSSRPPLAPFINTRGRDRHPCHHTPHGFPQHSCFALWETVRCALSIFFFSISLSFSPVSGQMRSRLSTTKNVTPDSSSVPTLPPFSIFAAVNCRRDEGFFCSLGWRIFRSSCVPSRPTYALEVLHFGQKGGRNGRRRDEELLPTFFRFRSLLRRLEKGRERS